MLYSQFVSQADFEKLRDYAQDLGVLTWQNEKKRTVVSVTFFIIIIFFTFQFKKNPWALSKLFNLYTLFPECLAETRCLNRYFECPSKKKVFWTMLCE